MINIEKLRNMIINTYNKKIYIKKYIKNIIKIY